MKPDGHNGGEEMPMKKPAKQTPEKRNAVEVHGKCTIEKAGRIRTLLMERLAEPGGLILNLSGVSEVDLSFLQLLCAAHKSASNSGKAFGLEGALSEPLILKAREAGFACRGECGPHLNGGCLWTEV
jgi:anti-anti-sigma regulatory factor